MAESEIEETANKLLMLDTILKELVYIARNFRDTEKIDAAQAKAFEAIRKLAGW